MKKRSFFALLVFLLSLFSLLPIWGNTNQFVVKTFITSKPPKIGNVTYTVDIDNVFFSKNYIYFANKYSAVSVYDYNGKFIKRYDISRLNVDKLLITENGKIFYKKNHEDNIYSLTNKNFIFKTSYFPKKIYSILKNQPNLIPSSYKFYCVNDNGKILWSKETTDGPIGVSKDGKYIYVNLSVKVNTGYEHWGSMATILDWNGNIIKRFSNNNTESYFKKVLKDGNIEIQMDNGDYKIYSEDGSKLIFSVSKSKYSLNSIDDIYFFKNFNIVTGIKNDKPDIIMLSPKNNLIWEYYFKTFSNSYIIKVYLVQQKLVVCIGGSDEYGSPERYALTLDLNGKNKQFINGYDTEHYFVFFGGNLFLDGNRRFISENKFEKIFDKDIHPLYQKGNKLYFLYYNTNTYNKELRYIEKIN